MQKPPFEILFEDNHLIAINKRAGEIAQPDETGDTPLGDKIKMYIKEKYDKPGNVYLGVIHRLDRPVSGVIIFAKTSKALERMNKAFKDRKIEKTYLAVVTERPKLETGTLVHYLIRNSEKNMSQAFLRPVAGAQKAVLHYELLATLGQQHLLKVTPTTGRHHQIRVQMARLGCPIRGDIKYGANKPNLNKSIHLHAYKLSFQHPVTGEEVHLTAYPTAADDVWRLFRDFWRIR